MLREGVQLPYVIKDLRKAARSGVSHKDGKYIDNKVAVGSLVVCEEERDVFEVLGLDYKEPHERNGEPTTRRRSRRRRVGCSRAAARRRRVYSSR